MKRLTQKELSARWNVCLRTVQREIRRFGLKPADYIGIQPVFDLERVERMERKRAAARARQLAEIRRRARLQRLAEAA